MNARDKHTPGPWIVSEKRDGLLIIRQKDRATTLLPIGHVLAAGWEDKETAMANAALIAAAPALLEALRELTTVLDFHDEQTDTEKSWIKTARAAIAQAEGETK